MPDNSILVTANMQSETGSPSSHQLKSYVASKSRLKLAARAVLSADAGLLVIIIIIIQHLYSALKSCKGYGGAGGFRLRLSEQVCFGGFFKGVQSVTRSIVV